LGHKEKALVDALQEHYTVLSVHNLGSEGRKAFANALSRISH